MVEDKRKQLTLTANMKVITAIYLNCRPELRDEWLSGQDQEIEMEDALVCSAIAYESQAKLMYSRKSTPCELLLAFTTSTTTLHLQPYRPALARATLRDTAGPIPSRPSRSTTQAWRLTETDKQQGRDQAT